MSMTASRLLCVLLPPLLYSGAVKAAEETEDPMLAFVLGDYVIVGQDPDGGAAYSGSASIEADGSALKLKRRRGEETIEASGKFETPSPPGEGRVLRFRWGAPGRIVMTCLIGVDLDNYPRLTCLWGREDPQPKTPGLEAMFSGRPAETPAE